MKFKNIIAVSLVFAILFGLGACKKLENSSEFEQITKVYVVDEGEEYEIQTRINQENETEHYYLDDNNEVVIVRTEESDKGKTEYYKVDEQGNKVALKTETKKKVVKTTSAGTTNEDTSVSLTPEQQSFVDNFNKENMEDYLDDNAEKATLNLGDNVHNLNNAPTIADPSNATKRQDDSAFYDKIKNANKVTLKMTMKTIQGNTSQTMPLTMIKSGDKVYLSTSMPVENEGGTSGSMTMNVIVKDGKCRVYIPNIKGYFEVPSSEVEAMKESFSIGTERQDNQTYLYSVKSQLNGKPYEVDVYSVEGGTIYYYYETDGVTPKRIEAVYDNGDISILEYTEISYTADESKFIYPIGYFNMTDLMGGETTGGLFSGSLF